MKQIRVLLVYSIRSLLIIRSVQRENLKKNGPNQPADQDSLPTPLICTPVPVPAALCLTKDFVCDTEQD